MTLLNKHAQLFLIGNTALLLLMVFAAVQFLLILKHKSPYLSDSYFYKHIVYELKGHSKSEARGLVLNEINFESQDKITRNIFLNEKVYYDALGFFTKRPLYPFSVFALNNLFSIHFSMLIPIFLSYLGSIFLSYKIFSIKLNHLFSILATSLLISFYPFLDWSTYFMTDTIGFAFWVILLLITYYFILHGQKSSLKIFSGFFIVSLLNREQNILMPILFFLLLVIMVIKSFKKEQITRVIYLFFASTSISLIYILLSAITDQKNILDTLVYTKNDYGLLNNSYSYMELIKYVTKTVYVSHIAFLKDLVSHHWWFTFSILALISSIYTLFNKEKQILSVLLISSAIASYLAIYIYPVLSYRYFYPVVLTIIYLSMFLVQKFFSERESLFNKQKFL